MERLHLGQNESQRMYKPVKIGLRLKLMMKQEASWYTRTSRNGITLLHESKSKRSVHFIKMGKKFASLRLTTKYAECVINIAEVHIRYRTL